jgi:uncharacterized protein (TIGR02301 family)
VTRAAVATLGLAALLAASGGAAETSAPKAAPPSSAAPAPNSNQPAPAPPPAAERPPPYEPQLLRLAEMTGALAYLRNLCGAGDGEKFRARMAELLEAEGVSDARRDLLAGAYNRGFRDYQTTYRMCTPAASAVIDRYLTETARLAAEVAGRYGG